MFNDTIKCKVNIQKPTVFLYGGGTRSPRRVAQPDLTHHYSGGFRPREQQWRVLAPTATQPKAPGATGEANGVV